MQDFTDLEVWKKARVFKNKVYSLCSSFSKDEKYRLTDQLIRSTRSISANISEGHGRYHYQENIQFCRMARGSLTESKDHIITALDIGEIDDSKYKELMVEYDHILKIVNCYIAYLKKRKNE